MTQEELTEVGGECEGELAIYINADGEICGVDDGVAQLFGFETEEFVGMSICSLFDKGSLEAGKNLQQMLDGNVDEHKSIVRTQEGRRVAVEMDVDVLVSDGEKLVEVTPTNIEEQEPAPDNESVTTDPTDLPMDDINDTKMKQIVQNIRVDAPNGEMTLNAIMLDLAVGHNELEEYKHGALTLHQAVDERLEEEEMRNPNSDEVAVLNEVKKSAFGLYQRIQQGDRNRGKSVNV